MVQRYTNNNNNNNEKNKLLFMTYRILNCLYESKYNFLSNIIGYSKTSKIYHSYRSYEKKTDNFFRGYLSK